MKSLEHIIREIREGKSKDKGDKTSLEHSIRKVVKGEAESSFGAKDSKPVDEDVGGLAGSGTGGEPKLHAEDGKKKKTDEAVGTLGTDKFQGTEFKSIRTATPHIKPPGPGHEHSQAPENASRLRSIAKEKVGINRVTEEEITEAPKTKFAEPTKSTFKPAPVAPEATKSTALTTTTAKPVATTAAPSATTKAVSTVGRYASAIGKAVTGKAATTLGLVVDPDFGGLLPSKGETKSEFERQKEQSAKAKTATATKPVELPTIDVKSKPAEPKVAPVAAPEPKVAPVAPPAKPAAPAAPAAPATPAKDETPKPKIAGIPMLGVPHDIDYTVSHLHRPNISRGHAKASKKHAMKEEARKEIENMPREGDRKSIEYVGRKDAEPKTSKEKTSRLATIKNVLDEAKKAMADKKVNPQDGKTKVYDYGDNVLVINPNQKNLNLDPEGHDKVAKDYENK